MILGRRVQQSFSGVSYTVKRAFTLIELLVVIAIIAILAAILFPVFTQAKLAAKKTAALTNAKQSGTSLVLYASNNDDLLPCANVPNLSNPAVIAYRSNDDTVQNPAGWFNYPLAQDEYALMWNNSTEPYRKNYDILNASTPEINITGATWSAGYAAQVKAPKPSHFTMNGFLHHWSLTAIDAPSILPLLWEGMGKLSKNGASMANPRLNCTGTGPCIYNGGGLPQAGATGTSMYRITYPTRAAGGPTQYTFGPGQIFVSTDTSARYVPLGRGNAAPFPVSTNTVNFYASLDTDGYIDLFAIRGRFVNGILFIAAFSPDNTFAN